MFVKWKWNKEINQSKFNKKNRLSEKVTKILSISDVRGQVFFFGSLQGPLVLVRG